MNVQISTSEVRLLAFDLAAAPLELARRQRATTRTYGQILRTTVRRNASGRSGVTGIPAGGGLPGEIGPRVQTGDYRRGIGLAVGTSGADNDYAQVFSTSPQGWRLEKGFIGADSLGRVYCVDDETEILTAGGWMRHDQLVPGTPVMTLNPDTWLSEWSPLRAVHRFPGTTEVIHLSGRTLDCMTTPGHRWLVERYYGRGRRWIREWRTTENMVSARVPLPQKCATLPQHATLDDDIVELIGWFWTEGSYDWSRRADEAATRQPTDRAIGASIAQSERVYPANVDRIRRLLTRVLGAPGPFTTGAHWREAPNRQTGVIAFKMDRVACWLMERHIDQRNKALRPSFLMLLTQAQLDLLIEVSLLADGSVDCNGVTKLGQANEARIRSWEMANVLAGRAVVTRYMQRRGFKTWTTTTLRTAHSHAFGSARRPDRDHAQLTRTTVDFVWCPETSNGTWLARRNGTIYFTGNSQPPFPHFGPALDEIGPKYQDALEQDYLAVEAILLRTRRAG